MFMTRRLVILRFMGRRAGRVESGWVAKFGPACNSAAAIWSTVIAQFRGGGCINVYEIVTFTF